MRPVVVRALLLPLPVEPRQILARRRLDARGLRQRRQKILIAFARVPPDDAAQGRVRFQRRGVHADRRALQQLRRREALSTHTKTAWWVSRSIRRRVREIVE